MKCFEHPDRDAVGFCSRCGKTVCSDIVPLLGCAREFGGAIYCYRCVDAVSQEAAEAEPMDAAKALRSARKTIRWSWVVTGVFSVPLLIALWISEDGSLFAKIFLPCVIAYSTWSWFWGCVLIRDRWAKPSWGLGMIVFMFFLVAAFIGPYGGGIYQFLVYRRIVKNAVA